MANTSPTGKHGGRRSPSTGASAQRHRRSAGAQDGSIGLRALDVTHPDESPLHQGFRRTGQGDSCSGVQVRPPSWVLSRTADCESIDEASVTWIHAWVGLAAWSRAGSIVDLNSLLCSRGVRPAAAAVVAVLRPRGGWPASRFGGPGFVVRSYLVTARPDPDPLHVRSAAPAPLAAVTRPAATSWRQG